MTLRLHFEDFTPGWSQICGPLQVSKDDILTFAREFDPQDFHTDEKAARESFIGALIGSGWHTCALNMRLIADGILLDSTCMGAPGVDEVKWVRPVKPGDTLRSRATVLESRASKSRPDIGLVRFSFETFNQADEIVLTQTNWIIFGRRDAGASAHADKNASHVRLSPTSRDNSYAATEGTTGDSYTKFLEDLTVGATDDLGSFTFTADDIVRFARAYDPQRFHVDPEAARQSLFGGLCASGWHTAAVWMKLMIGHRKRLEEKIKQRGGRLPRLGPSPGFKNLKWLKPVYVGDTVAYRSTIIETRLSTSRPGWGLASCHNSGINQHGEEIFSFDSTVFWERRS